MISELERFLGRDLSVPPTVETLNDLTPAMLDDLRVLHRDRASWLLSDTYVRLHVKLRDRGWLEDFVEDVVKGGADPRGWGGRDRLVVPWDMGPNWTLTMSVEKLQRELSAIGGARWWREPPRNAFAVNHDASWCGWGHPAVLVRKAPYWWTTPSESLTGFAVYGLEEVPEHTLDIAIRRWIAFRVAWWLKFAPGGLEVGDPEAIVNALGVAPATVTEDAAIDLAALVRELRLPFDPNLHVRGYVGPDDWYRG